MQVGAKVGAQVGLTKKDSKRVEKKIAGMQLRGHRIWCPRNQFFEKKREP